MYRYLKEFSHKLGEDIIPYVWLSLFVVGFIICFWYIAIPLLLIAFLIYKYFTSDSFVEWCNVIRPRIEENANIFRSEINRNDKDERFTEFSNAIYTDIWNHDHPCDKHLLFLASVFDNHVAGFEDPNFDPKEAYQKLLKFADENGF